MKALAAALLLILISTDGASAIACSRSKTVGSYSQWRLVDGKRCWYKGHRRIDKSSLSWAVAKSRPMRHTRPKAIVKPTQDPLTYTYWPEIEAETTEESMVKAICEHFGFNGVYLGNNEGECNPP